MTSVSDSFMYNKLQHLEFGAANCTLPAVPHLLLISKRSLSIETRFKVKNAANSSSAEATPKTRWEAYSVYPDPLAGFKGPYLTVRAGEGEGGGEGLGEM